MVHPGAPWIDQKDYGHSIPKELLGEIEIRYKSRSRATSGQQLRLPKLQFCSRLNRLQDTDKYVPDGTGDQFRLRC